MSIMHMHDGLQSRMQNNLQNTLDFLEYILYAVLQDFYRRTEMALDRWGRKALFPYGKQQKIAAEVGVSESVVSQVMAGKKAACSAEKLKKIQARIARTIGVPLKEAFPPEAV